MPNGNGTLKKIAAPLAIAAIIAAGGVFASVGILKDRDDRRKEDIKSNEVAIENVREDITDIKFAQQELGFEQRQQRTTIEAVDANVKRILDKLNDSP